MALEKVNESVLYDCQWTAPAENMLSSCCPRNSRGSEKTESPAETHATVHDFSRYVLRPLYHPCNELSMCRRALDKGMARAVCRSRIYFHETSQLSATTKGRVQAVQPRYCITNLGGWYLLNTGTRHQASFPVDREHISSTEINQDQLTFDWDSFLGRSAPHLRHLRLVHIPFPLPVLRKLLLSAPNLVILSIRDLPHSAYFPPEAMATCLSALTRLEVLFIGFESPRSRPTRESRRPPPTRSILPALTTLRFTGVSEYLEDLVTRISAPLLNLLVITFFHQLIFDTPQLVQFISRTPKLKGYDEARVILSDQHATIALPGRDSRLKLGISCRQSDWQLSSLVQVFTSSFPQALILTVERLCILEYESSQPWWQDDIEYDQWFELFHPFTTVKKLYLSRKFLPRIVPTLQELVGERVTEMLPNLQRIFLQDLQEPELVPEAMRRFIAARQLSSRPIAISHWNGWSTIDDIDN
jgi:hypothetical protein